MLSKITLALAFALAVSFAATASAQQHIPGSPEAWNGLVWDPPGYAGAARQAAPDVTQAPVTFHRSSNNQSRSGT
jgi:hypothetical protein